MCGIVGFWGKESLNKKKTLIKKMALELDHRGPDGDGYYCDSSVALGHKRLAILDLEHGDEPMINTDCVEEVIKQIKEDKDADISTLVSEIESDESINDPNCVKCVFDKNNYALYFSRSKIPYERKEGISKFYKHIGIYGYKREALFKMTSLPQSDIEKTESLEQLRALYNGMKIKVSTVNYVSIGIDTKEDLNEFKKLVEC